MNYILLVYSKDKYAFESMSGIKLHVLNKFFESTVLLIDYKVLINYNLTY